MTRQFPRRDTRRRKEGICGRTISAWEEGLAAEHFRKDTTDAPDIDCAGVFFEGEHDFRCTVPPARIGTEIVSAESSGLGGHPIARRANANLVATYSVMKVLLSLATLGGGRAERARPKSQSCGHVQSEMVRIKGFKPRTTV